MEFFGEHFGMVISTFGAALAAGLAGIGSAKGISLTGQAAAGLIATGSVRRWCCSCCRVRRAFTACWSVF